MATIQDFEERIEKQKAELAKLEAKKKELEKKIRERNRIPKNPTGNRKGSRVTETTGSLFSCPHSEIKATGRKDFRYCSTAHRRTGRKSGRTI